MLARFPKAEVIAVCEKYEPFLRRAKEAAPKAEGYTDYRKVLENKDVQAVLITTPTHQHKEIVQEALKAGKHVYCEAPLANTIENTKLFTKAQIAEVEEERRRLLHDLLDSVYQALFAADLTADVLPKLWETDPDQGRQALGDMKRFTHGALAEIRVLMVELRSPKR